MIEQTLDIATKDGAMETPSAAAPIRRFSAQAMWTSPLILPSNRCVAAELRALFERAGNPGELELYPGVHHGFAFPQRKVYDKPAAERHWELLIALYRRRFG